MCVCFLCLRHQDAVSRSRLALAAFFSAHVPMLLGLILIAAAVKKTIVHPYEPLATAPSVALAGGVALYLGGIAWDHRILKIGPQRFHCTAALLAVLAIPMGHSESALAEVILLGVLIGAALLSDHRWTKKMAHLSH